MSVVTLRSAQQHQADDAAQFFRIDQMMELFLAQAHLPVPQFAWVGVIAFLTAIFQRAYNVSGTGLNQNFLVIAKTGRGKESIASFFAKLIAATKKSVPSVVDFVGPSHIASPEAILKWLSRQPCCYSLVGEFGLKLKEMASPRANPNTSGLKRVMLDLYNKSGRDDTLNAMAYADSSKNSAIIQRPCWSVIGDGTPQTVYENIDINTVNEGTLSRFLITDYDGPRVDVNESAASSAPSPGLAAWICEAVAHSVALNSTNQICDVHLSPEALTISRNFAKHATAIINADHVGTVSELWNRAHVKALKLAAIYAIAFNYHTPIISGVQMQRATDEIAAQTIALISKFNTGQMGSVDTNEAMRRTRMTKVVYNYAANAHDNKFTETFEMREARIISQDRMQQQLYSTAPYRNAKCGPTQAFRNTLKDLLDGGILVEISKADLNKRFGKSFRAFAISNAEVVIEEGQG